MNLYRIYNAIQVDIDLTVVKWISLSYLQDIFQGIHPPKLEELRVALQDCIRRTGKLCTLHKVDMQECKLNGGRRWERGVKKERRK